MNADGSQAHPLIKTDPGFHLFKPTWFPTSKRIAYFRYRIENGQANFTLESRNLQGADPVALVSSPKIYDFAWAQPGRLIYTANEFRPNQFDSNLWQLHFDPETGKPQGQPQRLTDWTGFSFSDPQLTADAKRLVFLNDHGQSDVYIGELTQNGAELKSPQRLTLDDRLDWPGAWLADGKTVLFYSDRNGHFDIYKQAVTDRDPQSIATATTDKWNPEISPDAKWILYTEWPIPAEGAAVPSGKIMRAPIAGGPAEPAMEIKGYPGIASSSLVLNSSGGFPSFRCPRRPGADCVVAEAPSASEKQITFTAFDPVQGRKSELTKVAADPNEVRWDLSPDGTRIAVTLFDYKEGNVEIHPLAGGTPQKISVLPYPELVAVAWSADGQSLYLDSYSSRGTTIIHSSLTGDPKPLFKSTWEIFSLSVSPDGHYLALGPVIYNANAWTIAPFPVK